MLYPLWIDDLLYESKWFSSISLHSTNSLVQSHHSRLDRLLILISCSGTRQSAPIEVTIFEMRVMALIVLSLLRRHFLKKVYLSMDLTMLKDLVSKDRSTYHLLEES